MAYDYLTEEERKNGDTAWMMWWNRIKRCHRFRQEYAYGERLWQRYYSIYAGVQWEDLDDLYDISSDNLAERITVNVTASNILSIVPFLVNEKAQFHCEPRKPADVINAMLKEKVLNYEFHRKAGQIHLRKVVYDSVIIGHGIAKTGFVRQVDEAASKAIGDIEYDQMIEDESVYVKRVDPLNFWFDYSGCEKNLETARFTIERYYKYIPDLIENTSYRSSVRSKIEDGTYSIKGIKSDQYNNADDYSWIYNYSFENYESELAVLYEVWDKKYNQVLTFVEGVLEPLRVIDNPYPYLKGEFPYLKTDFIYVPNRWYGSGIPAFIEHQQFELNRHRTFGFNHRRRFSARKYEVTEDVDPEEIEKLPDAEDGTYIIVPSINSIKPIEDVPLPRDYVVIESLIKGDIAEMTGADALQRGQALQSRATLGEVQTRSNILSLKLNEKVSEVDRLFLGVGVQLASHIGANYYKSLVVRLVGLQGEFWVEVNNEDLKDEVDIKIETVSAPRRNPDLDVQQRIQIFQYAMQMLPLIQAGEVPRGAINFVELFKWTIEGFERVDVGRFFKPSLNPTSPFQEELINPAQAAQQFVPQQQQVEQPAGGNAQDLIRSLSAGNSAGLQVAGVGAA